MTSSEALTHFKAARAKLEARRAEVEAELAQIDRELGRESVAVPNRKSLKEAIAELTRGGPLTRDEILEGLPRVGYHFKSAKPRNSLNALLHDAKAGIKRTGNGSEARFKVG